MNPHADNRPDCPPAPVSQVYHQRFSVAFDYPVVFTHDVFAPANPALAEVMDRLGEGRRRRAVVYVDDGLAHAMPELPAKIREYFHARPGQIELAGGPTLVPGGEAAKTNWDTVREVMWTLGNLHMDRQSYVIAVGGGSMLDMIGFATSLVHRGLRLIRVPTTVLAQNDAAVGVKNGMDEHGQKNFVGTFAPPFAVIDDFDFLPRLSDAQWIGGVAEAFKVAIIKDAAFFDFLCEQAPAIARRDLMPMEQLIRRCAVLHLEHIAGGGDAFEMGSARPLDFGHWSAHKLEVMSGWRLGHGPAVAVGLALDSYYAMRTGKLSAGDLARVWAGLRAVGLPIWTPELHRRTADGMLEILDGLNQFREHLGGVLTLTLPDGLGRRCEIHTVNPDIMEEGVEALKAQGHNDASAQARGS